MKSRIKQSREKLKNLQQTQIVVEIAHPRQSLKKDIIEAVTGLSNNAISAGGRITAETVVYSGESTPTQVTAGLVFSALSLGANIIDFFMIPLGYLYKLYCRDKVPFNVSNNLKWFLAGVTLTLAVISLAVAVASRIISFISVGISMASAIFACAKYFYDRHLLQKKLAVKNEKIDKLCDAIKFDMQLINEYQRCLRGYVENPQTSPAEMAALASEIDELYAGYVARIAKLKKHYHAKVLLERALKRQHSPLEWATTGLKFLFATAVLVGTILALNPVTLPIGMPIIAATALLGLVTFIVKKTIEVIQKRHERKRASIDQVAIKIDIDSSTTILKACKHVSMRDSDDDIIESEVAREKQVITQKMVAMPFLSEDDERDEVDSPIHSVASVALAKR